MTETIYSRLEAGNVEEDKNLYVGMEELSVSEETVESLTCEVCVRKNPLFESIAVFMCFVCKIYVCVNCRRKHESHDGLQVKSKKSERKKEREESERTEVRSDREKMTEPNERMKNRGKGLGKKTKRMRLQADSERQRETDEILRQSERERMRRNHILNIMNESEENRIKNFKNNHYSIYDRVDVRHELDKEEDCWITGLCGLENKKLVVCDDFNSCIKIYKLGGHLLQRYIRFVGSPPRDVTEIHLKQNLVTSSSSGLPGTGRADQKKQCLVAVTIPKERKIILIDFSKKPAKPSKVIRTEERCYSIAFFGGNIYTGCKETRDSPCLIYVKSTDGETLAKFDSGSYDTYIPYLAVVSERVLLTNYHTNKVQSRNVEGQVISEIKIEESWLGGISVDSDNKVYVCARRHKNVYKLDSHLTQYSPVLDQSTDYVEDPDVLCYYRSKLFISHGLSSSRNFVTVVRLL